MNMLLATPVLSDAATITSSTAPSSLPALNLKTMSIREVCRLGAESYIEIDLLSAKDINLVALLAHTGSVSATARVRGALDYSDLLTSPDYDSGDVQMRSHLIPDLDEVFVGADPVYVGSEPVVVGSTDTLIDSWDEPTCHFLHFFETESLRYIRIDISEPEASYIDIGRLYASNAWEPEYNFSYEFTEGQIDPSTTARTAAGRLSSRERPKYRFAEWKHDFLSPRELFDYASDIERKRGTTKDVLFIPDYEGTQDLQRRTIYGVLKAQAHINSYHQIFQKTFRIEEITA